ncbi:uncharacterized protein LOC107849193 [Capsicum annuum]|uniref:uncharacterized protein LOC107849193 n=1 Tax=Capsicum annuum TaxID=4072 RepID=UPI001FB0B109|nr:uncharacterized protein LOC107849193 [Capsicum annuum]
MRNLELKLGQIVGAQNTRPQGALPSNTETNTKQLNALTTRSGLQTKKTVQEQGKESSIGGKLQEVLRSSGAGSMNLYLVDILQSVPKYAKYLKDIVANKNRLAEYATVSLTQECTSKIQNKLPMKLKDPGSFTLYITIRQTIFACGLSDLGASITLIPTSWYQKIGLRSPKTTTIILQLADRSLSRPSGIIEDVLVQVGSLIFLVNFVILDFEADPVVPFILGWPFLETGQS